MSWRFSTVEESGDWLVRDNEHIIPRTNLPRVVATCAEQQEAAAIAAFMNGDLEGGRQLHQDFLGYLKSCCKS